MENNEYIYHYTSIETLALILNSRQIRFTSLKNVDDLEEIESLDSKSFGKFFFVSCWTKDSIENIALWNMYTPKMKGVRIKLPNNFLNFNKDKISTELCKSNLKIIKNREFKNAGENIINVSNKYIVSTDVRYTDDELLLKMPIIEECLLNFLQKDDWKKDYYLQLVNMARMKSKQWAFQKEYRFIISVLPKNIEYEHINHLEKELILKRLNDFDTIPENIDIDIQPEMLNQMEILLGPKTGQAEKLIVDALIAKYNQDNNGSIKMSKKSELRIRN